MAEAVVDGMSSKIFCHECSREINSPLLPDYKCPLCSSGFIEIVNDVNSGDTSMDVTTEDLELSDPDLLNYVEFDSEQPHPSGHRSSFTRENWRRRPLRERGDGVIDFRHAFRNARLTNNSNDDHSLQPYENLFQDFIVNLSRMNFPIQGQQPLLNISLLLENPGDYVFGREGLDAIVTQLLNQMDGTGPPPLSKRQIEDIPIVAVAQAHIDIKLQCSVCWEDFILSESVKQLPCQHLYHVPCIVPWLELHGTCPICRQSLNDQSSTDSGNEPQSQDTVNLATIFSAPNQSSSSSSTTSSTSSPTTSTP